MKKYSWIAALLAALALVLGTFGCGGEVPPEGGRGDGIVKTLTIPANPYGPDNTSGGNATMGFQLQLKGGEAPFADTAAQGDVYKLTLTFTTNRAVAQPLFVGIADTDPSVDYWKALSWDSNSGDMDKIFESATEGEEITKTITFAALSDTSTSLDSSTLAFQTEDELHTLGSLILECTEYKFEKQP